MAHGSAQIFMVVIAAMLAISAHPASGDETTNRLAANSLISNRLAGNRLAANRLSANRLAANRLAGNGLRSANEAELLETAEGRELFSYIVSCALPEAVEIEAAVPGAPDSAPPETTYACTDGQCVFAGALGRTGSTARSSRRASAGSARVCSRA